ncbi:MAG TPA: signal peptidase I [Arenimonas sp.]|nr:signal peptidase I [Arenimonas sp.]
MKTTWQQRWHDNKNFICFIVLMVMFRSSLADWNSVPTGSMQPTIVEGDRIWVNKLAYDLKLPLSHTTLWTWANPQRGDIVVFDSKVEDTRLVKRVIGLPGDSIAMQNNQLFINGELAQYKELNNSGLYTRAIEDLAGIPHAMQIDATQSSPASSFATVIVPNGQYLVLGDNRDNSKDSRFIGFVPRQEIIGRASYVVTSFNYDNYYLPRSKRWFQRLDAPFNSAN